MLSHLVQTVPCLDRKRNELPTYDILLKICWENAEIIIFCLHILMEVWFGESNEIVHFRMRNLRILIQ